MSGVPDRVGGGSVAALMLGRKENPPSVIRMQSVWPIFHLFSCYRSPAHLVGIQYTLLESMT